MACRPAGAGRDQDPHQRVVIDVAAGVARRLAAHVQRPDADAGHEVGGPEHQGLQSRRGRRDRVHRGQAAGVLDLRLDPGLAGRQAGLPLHLPEQQVQPHHVLGRGHLGQHDRVQPRRWLPPGSPASTGAAPTGPGPTAETTSMTSRWAHWVDDVVDPDGETRPPQSWPAPRPRWPWPALWPPGPRRPPGRGTPRRRADPCALAMNRSLLAGTARTDRRTRYGRSIAGSVANRGLPAGERWVSMNSSRTRLRFARLC